MTEERTLYVVADLDAPRTVRIATPDEAQARAFYDQLARQSETVIAAVWEPGKELRRLWWPKPGVT